METECSGYLEDISKILVVEVACKVDWSAGSTKLFSQ
jgi:hypothetical protein